MDRIELYIDSEERLTIDLFEGPRSDNYLTRKKGQQCYGNIAEICSKPVTYVKYSSDKKDFYVFFDDCYIHVNESERVIGRRGTAPIFRVANKYLEEQKRKEVEQKNAEVKQEPPKPLKVTRKNKHVGAKIIATSLAFAMLMATLIYNSNTMNVNDYNDITIEQTQVTEQEQVYIVDLKHENEESTSPTVQVLVNNEQNTPPKGQDLIEQEQNQGVEIFIPYDDRSNTEKAQITRAYYGDTIEKYAKTYGLDPKIMIGIATQERGIHSDRMDPGGATGLMQIQNEVWIGSTLTAYNVETNQYETVTVTRDDLSDVFTNIRYGCMIYQNCLGYMNGNALAAIQCYNMGYGNMSQILKSYSLESGKSTNEILNDITDNGWLSHRNIIDVGDRKYLEHVLSWIGSEVDINIVDSKGNLEPIIIRNESKVKSIS